MTFQLSFSASLAPVSLPIDLNLNLGSFAALNTSSTIQLTPTVQAAMTVGVNLAPQVAVLTAADDAPSDGVLTSAATFALAVGSFAAATMVVPPDPRNHSLDDLVADLNAAIAALPSIAGKVQAGRQGSRLTLSTTAQANSPILQLTANAADPAVTQLGFTTSQSASGDLTSQFFIQNASASGSVTLATSDLQFAARLGFFDVGVVNGTALATASASVALKDPVSGTPGGRITLQQLTDCDPRRTRFDHRNAEHPSGRSAMTLPIHVDPDFFGSGQPANPALSVAWTNILDTNTLTVTPNADFRRCWISANSLSPTSSRPLPKRFNTCRRSGSSRS